MRLVAEGLSFTYRRGVPALREMDLDVQGGCIGLLGPNGAGKSTFLSLLTGALRPQAGSLSPGPGAAGLGFVPQDMRIDPSLTTEQFLGYCAWLKKIPRARWGEQTSRVLAQLDLVEQRNRRIGSLSGGLRRRVALAQSLLGEPDLIVLDEPTTALDPAQRHGLLRLVEAVKPAVGVVLSTHLVEDVVATADAVVILDEGRVAWNGPLLDIAPGPDRAGQLERFFLSVTGAHP